MKLTEKKQSLFAILMAFLSKNIAIGFTFGAYGLMVSQLENDFDGGRAASSLGVGLIALTMGLASPGLGYLLDRWSIRGSMFIGYLLGAAGFWLASTADSITSFMFFFGVVVGVSVASTGVLPASKLATNWYPKAPGRALAFANLPVIVAIGPPIFGAIIASDGWRELLQYFAWIFLAFSPLVLLIKDQPETSSQVKASEAQKTLPDNDKSLLSDFRFWITAFVAGSLFSGGIVMVTHVVAHAVEKDIALEQASLLLSINGACAVAGAFLFGWIADRYNPGRALLIIAGIQVVMWPALILATSIESLAAAVAVLGICMGGTHTALSSLINFIYGQHRFGTVLGQVTLFIIPFNFSIAPLAGYLYDVSGSYTLAFSLQALLCALSLACLLFLTRNKVDTSASQTV